MAYANGTDLQIYLGPGTALPDEAGRLLERASDMINLVTLNRIPVGYMAEPNPADLQTVFVQLMIKQATCAIVEFWMQTDESHAILAPSGGLSVGSINMAQLPNQLAPRARGYLLRAGFLNRGVRSI